MINTPSDAQRVLRQTATSTIVPQLGTGWSQQVSGKMVRLVRPASDIHSERVFLVTRSRAGQHLVGVGVGVRYPLCHWIETCGENQPGRNIGFHVGLRFHPPGQDEWDLRSEGWVEGVLNDIERFGRPYFSEMESPGRVIDIVARRDPSARPFSLGGPDESVCTVASMFYAYIDKERGVECLRVALKDRESTRLRRLCEFLHTAPDLPRFGPAD